MDELINFINKKQKEAETRFKKNLEREIKKFDFIRMFISEHKNEIMDYASLHELGISSENIYELSRKIAHLLEDCDGGGQLTISLDKNSKLEDVRDYLLIKLGFFKINGADKSGNLEITEKGEEIRKKYFV